MEIHRIAPLILHRRRNIVVLNIPQYLPLNDSMDPTSFVENVVKAFDSRFSMNLYSTMARTHTMWLSSRTLNFIRRKTNPLLLKRSSDGKTIRLHLGCGTVHLDGFYNLDWNKTRATDYVIDIKKLPLRDGCTEKIESYHVIEHIGRHDVLDALKEWNRVLAPGGQLILEFPDFDKDIEEYQKGDDSRLDSIFGLQRFGGDTHLFGYNLRRMTVLLKQSGFSEIRSCEPLDYHSNYEPCLRIECIK